MEPVAPQVQTPPPQMPEIVSPKKKLVVLASIIIGALVVGGSVFGAYKAGFIGEPNPESVLHTMEANLETVKAFSYDLQVNMEVPLPKDLAEMADATGAETSAPEKTNILVTARGALDMFDEENVKSTMKLDGSAKVGGKDNGFGFEVRITDNVPYISLTKAPVIGIFDLRMFEGKWVSYQKLGELKKSLRALQSKAAAESGLALTDEQKKQSLERFWKSGSIASVAKLKSESVNGVPAYHYALVLDKNALVKFEQDDAAALGYPMTAEEVEKAKKELENVNIERLEVWVGKKDYLPHKVYVVANNKKENETELNLAATAVLNNYNQHLTVEVPANVQTFEEILSEMFGGFGGATGENEIMFDDTGMDNTAPVKMENDAADADGDGLTNGDERILGTDPNNADTDGDGFKDGDEVKNGYSPLTSGATGNSL